MTKKKTPNRKSKSKARATKWAAKMAKNDHFVDRDLSLLEFNKRVLEQACDVSVPLLERLKFLGILHSNLDELFMKRMWISRLLYLNHPGSEAQAKLLNIKKYVLDLLARASEEFLKLKKELSKTGIYISSWEELNSEEKIFFTSKFKQDLFPVLTPLSVDQAHPFPHISTLSTSLAIALSYPGQSELVFSRLKIPSFFPSYYPMEKSVKEEKQVWVSTTDIIVNNLEYLFPKMKIEAVMPFRIVRNIEVEIDKENEFESLLTMISQQIQERKFGEVVKLEVKPPVNDWLLSLLTDELEVNECDIYPMDTELDFSNLFSLYSINRKDLKFNVWRQTEAHELTSDKNIFDSISQKDILLHHPFENFSTSVEKFILAAVDDPNVLAIKMTLYRTNQEGSIINALVRAAERGKQVVCLIELQARMDEEKNIHWANKLENAGCHVVYGIVGLKTHCKVALAVRREGARIKTYAHLGTGNYNSQTAMFYTDIGLLTAKSEITQDVVELFHYLTGRSLKNDYKKLIVAPVQMKDFILQKIREEIENFKSGKPTKIVIKCNNLEDNDVVEALYKASQAGVSVDLVVRSICTIKPGVKGLSENINVYSIVDRYLEHSRMFYFRNGEKEEAEGMMYIGSADLMYRNLTNRVEVLTPIEDKDAKREFLKIMNIYLESDNQTWKMNPNGTFTRFNNKVTPSQKVLNQFYVKQNS